MSYQVKLNPLKPYSRGVSIIGVGATPFMLTKDNPETKGLCEGELFGYAAIEAMKDAGITARDVGFFIHAQAGPTWLSQVGTPAMHVANWFGMKGKGNAHHSEACCTGYVSLEQAASYVASGAYDIVLNGACDFSYSVAYPDKPAFMRRAGTDQMFYETLCSIYPKDYTLESHAGSFNAENWLIEYAKENDLSHEQVDEVLCKIGKISREAAVKHPMGLSQKTYDEMAHTFKLKDADEFLHSKFNPFLGYYLRASSFEQRCDAAAAIIVCPTEMAYHYTDHPVEILGFGHSCLEASTGMLEKYATEAAYKQVKDLTGLSGADMDLFMTNDFIQPSYFLSAEACEYIPKNEAWNYILDNRTDITGDRPINPNGGRCHFGHASGTSGLTDICETVWQMRGTSPNQISHPVNHAMLRGFGGGQNDCCTILKNNERRPQ